MKVFVDSIAVCKHNSARNYRVVNILGGTKISIEELILIASHLIDPPLCKGRKIPFYQYPKGINPNNNQGLMLLA